TQQKDNLRWNCLYNSECIYESLL
ncbi:hypothetical protein Gasu_60860, partial [Galdieria sulphuraria]